METERRMRAVGAKRKGRDDAAAHADAVHPAEQAGEQGGEQGKFNHGSKIIFHDGREETRKKPKEKIFARMARMNANENLL
jgi:hypothetical protein